MVSWWPWAGRDGQPRRSQMQGEKTRKITSHRFKRHSSTWRQEAGCFMGWGLGIEPLRNVRQERGTGMNNEAGLADCHRRTFQERPLSFRNIDEWQNTRRLPNEFKAQSRPRPKQTRKKESSNDSQSCRALATFTNPLTGPRPLWRGYSQPTRHAQSSGTRDGSRQTRAQCDPCDGIP